MMLEHQRVIHSKFTPIYTNICFNINTFSLSTNLMASQRIQRRRKASSHSGPGGWFLRRFLLIIEFLALAKLNGAIKDSHTPDTDDDMSASNYNDELTQEQTLVTLDDRFPTSTAMERLRFLRACKGNIEGAVVKLEAYIDWRELHGLDSPEYQESKLGSTSDDQDWQESCSMALAYAEKMGLMGEKAKKKGNRSPKSESKKLPQIVFVHTDENGEAKKSLRGNLILHVMPGRLDRKKAPAEIYSLALGLYLDRKQNRESLDLFSVMLDVRGGKGWANPPAYNMMPFIKSAATLLHQHYPERLDKLIVYPLPRPALWIWHMVKPFLDVSVVLSAHLIGGKDTSAAPPPNDKLAEFVDLSILEAMEKHRLSTFTLPPQKSSLKISSSCRAGGKL
jgi:hypothetical protein